MVKKEWIRYIRNNISWVVRVSLTHSVFIDKNAAIGLIKRHEVPDSDLPECMAIIKEAYDLRRIDEEKAKKWEMHILNLLNNIENQQGE